MKIIFYSRVHSMDVFERGFYKQDIDILRSLGHTVLVTNRISDLLKTTDVYFVWWWTAAAPVVWLGKIRQIPVIITGTFNYNLGLPGDYMSRPGWHKRLIRFALREASANIFVSRLEHSLIQEVFTVNKPVYIPHVVDTSFYTPGGPRERTMVFNLAWSGRINARRKCLPQIIQAVPKVLEVEPNAQFIFAGMPGEAHPELVSLAKALGVEHAVEWKGVLDEREKLHYLQKCGVYVSPSLYEGFGLAIAEALSCGAPVVTSSVGAVPEVAGEAAIYVDGQNPTDIASGIIQLMQNPELSSTLSRLGRSRILQEFSYEVRRSGIRRLLREVT